jgi:hypothetical protein
VPRDPGQGGERHALHPAGRKRSLHLTLEFAYEQRQIERFGDPAKHRASPLGEVDRGLEQSFHPESRPDLDADQRVGVTGVREVVLHAGRDDDHLAWTRGHPLASEPEVHRPLDDREPLLLQWVDVPATRDATACREFEVDHHELTGRVGGGPPKCDPLAAGRILQCLSCVCHVVWPTRRRYGAG